MRKNRLAIASLALSAVACGGDGTAPPREITRREITLDLCGIGWAAYRNEGEEWIPLSSTLAVAPGPVTFTATDRFALATVSGVTGPDAFSPRLDIHYMTADQAEAAFACAGLAPTVRLNGSVAGVGLENEVNVSTGHGFASASAINPTFQVRAAKEGPIDVVATERLPPSDSPPTGRVSKIIIRRGENHADGATMPVLDFSSPEAITPQSNTLTIGGVPGGTRVSMQTHIKTRRGAALNLRYDNDQASQVWTTYSVPASRLADGDVHQGYAYTTNRELWFIYRTAADRTLAFGPAPNTPTFTQAPSSDQVLRIDLASQPEYGSWINIALSTADPSAFFPNAIAITVTREYLGGTPGMWSLVLPDLTGLPGYAPLWGLSPGARIWRLTASGAPHGFTLAAERDGDVYRRASAVGSLTIAQ
jgi:hypothetical protein